MKTQPMKPVSLVLLTTVAMVAFAANSILCRLALLRMEIDAASFTCIRVLSGAAALWLIVKMRGRTGGTGGSWLSALALFIYAAAFSFAYVQLPAGIGALLLFAAVQSSMIIWGMRKGERLHIRQWFGLALAVSGLIALLLPGQAAPSPGASILMLSAGLAWGIYSLRGKGVPHPIAATAGNFVRAAPMAAILAIVFATSVHITLSGLAYALISGAITSGLGYVIWYAVLPSLKATTAATVQLSAPVLAALGGILFLSETITVRLVLASIGVLGGIALVVIEKGARGPGAHVALAEEI